MTHETMNMGGVGPGGGGLSPMSPVNFAPSNESLQTYTKHSYPGDLDLGRSFYFKRETFLYFH